MRPGDCDACGVFSPHRHSRSYAGGGDDRVLVCCDCSECDDPDCEGRPVVVCANCGSPSNDLPAKCTGHGADFVLGAHVLVEMADAPRRVA
jgi:hypothetical protein